MSQWVDLVTVSTLLELIESDDLNASVFSDTHPKGIFIGDIESGVGVRIRATLETEKEVADRAEHDRERGVDHDSRARWKMRFQTLQEGEDVGT